MNYVCLSLDISVLISLFLSVIYFVLFLNSKIIYENCLVKYLLLLQPKTIILFLLNLELNYFKLNGVTSDLCGCIVIAKPKAVKYMEGKNKRPKANYLLYPNISNPKALCSWPFKETDVSLQTRFLSVPGQHNGLGFNPSSLHNFMFFCVVNYDI